MFAIMVITGQRRGAAHNECNSNYIVQISSSNCFHNISKYDYHLFVKKLQKTIPGNRNIIPQNKVGYISLSHTVDMAMNSIQQKGKVYFAVST